MNQLEKAGGRRFLLVLLLLAAATALLWFGKLSGNEWVSMMQASVVAYVVGNVAQRHIEAKAGVKDGATQPG